MTPKSPPTVKIPHELILKSRVRGVLSQVKFYYQLKVQGSDGFFRINEIDFCSKSYLYKQINNLLKLNWIKRIAGGFSLIKYDDFFKWFGYDMTLKISSKGIRAGSFKIFKIQIKDFSQFLTEIAKEEIQFLKKTLTQQRKGETVNVLLSSRKLSSILGYNSASSGFKVLQDLETNGTIQIIRSSINNLPQTNFILFNRTRKPGRS